MAPLGDLTQRYPLFLFSLLDKLFPVIKYETFTVIAGKIYVVGGNDGSSALNTTEIYDPENHTWSLGPTLCTHRANCGVVVIHDMLFAVGGFNGKKFLNSMECLDLRRSEYWGNDMPDGVEVEGNQNGDSSEENGFLMENGESNIDDVDMDHGDTSKLKLQTVISAEQPSKSVKIDVEVKHKARCNGDVNQDSKPSVNS